MKDLMTKLSEAVSFYFQDDIISPGVVTSTLKDGQIYMSIVRYDNKYNTGKNWNKAKSVVCHVKAPTMPEAITLLSKRFVEYTTEQQEAINPLEVLKKTIIYK